MKFLNIPGFIETDRYFAIWFLMWVETFFPVFPSEVILPLGVLGAKHGFMSPYGVAIAGTCGSMTGALMWYFLARKLGIARFDAFVTKYGRITTLTHKEVSMLQRLFDKYGIIIVFGGRLIPLLRSAVSIPAGLTGMRFVPFFGLTLAGAALWSGTLTYVCWLGRRYIEMMHEYIGPGVKIVIIACALLWLYRVITHKGEHSQLH